MLAAGTPANPPELLGRVLPADRIAGPAREQKLVDAPAFELAAQGSDIDLDPVRCRAALAVGNSPPAESMQGAQVTRRSQRR